MYEIGTDLRFFNGRLGLDFTYYDIKSTNQIIPVEIPISSGYTRRVLNAGEIRNRGIELMLNARPLQLSNGLTWNTSINFTRNRGMVVELAPEEGIDVYNLSSANGAYIQARTGQPMGAIYGYGNLRVSDKESPYYGQHIHSPDGTPLTSNVLEYQGNYNPDWMAGIQNSFSFKGLSLGFLFDVRYGGIVVSRTKTIGSTSGQLEETLFGRPNGYDLSLPENGIIGDGVKQVFDEEGNLTAYAPNDVKISSRDWHNRYYERNNVEVAKYDASFIKLRELKIGYSIPATLLGRSPIKGIDLSLVGRNLFLWTENPHFDPETASMGGGTLQPGMENMAYPSVRSMGINLSLKL